MSNNYKESTVVVAPKIILIIATTLCAASGFIPWLDIGGDNGPLVPIYIVSGLIPLILNIIALIIKRRGVSLASNILGIIGGLIAMLYVAFFFLGSSMYASNFIFSHLALGVWIALVSGLIMFVVSIVSIVKDKKKSHVAE